MAEQTPDVQAQYLELVRFLAVALLDEENVTVTASTKGRQPSINIAVPEALRGRIIGKGGRVIGSIRQLLESASFYDGNLPSLDIVD